MINQAVAVVLAIAIALATNGQVVLTFSKADMVALIGVIAAKKLNPVLAS